MSKSKIKTTGKKYWRSLNELANTPEFRKRLENEFPDGLFETDTGTLSRRDFIGLMSASLALAGLAGCRKPVEKIIPYVNPPEVVIPGIANHYATSMPFKTSAYGLIVESHEGRPTKIEGNPAHPSSNGAASLYMQASILNLYDPERSRRVMNKGVEKNWDQFVTFWRGLSEKYEQNGGEGLAVLTESFSSPTQSRLMEQFRKTYPKAIIACWEPSELHNRLDYFKKDGRQYSLNYKTDRAKVILALDADPLLTEDESLRNARGFAKGREIRSTSDNMNRLYAVEGNYSLTGAMADHRLRLPVGMIPAFLAALAVELKNIGLDLNLTTGFSDALVGQKFDHKWLGALADDLMKNKGASIITAGRHLGSDAHLMVLAMNEALGNFGKTMEFRDSRDVLESDFASLKNLADRSGNIETLIIIGGNPAYDTPADLEFANKLKNIVNSVHFGEMFDETSDLCTWHINRAHYLESWGDVRSVEGLAGVIQPLIAPLYNGKSEIELWKLLATGIDGRGYDIVRETWQDLIKGGDFDKKWDQLLHDGFLAGTENKTVTPKIDRRDISALKAASFKGSIPTAAGLDMVLYLSPAVYDGRFANNGWVQEWPDPITKLTWDNAALISMNTARDLGLKNGDKVNLKHKNGELETAVWIQPGLADNTVCMPLGYGRTKAGKVGNGVGFNAYKLFRSDTGYTLSGVKLTPLGDIHKYSNTQDHNVMEGRAIVREADLDYYRANPEFAPRMVEGPPIRSIFTEHKYDKGYQWGMTIDLNACIGCGACTIACQAENNIPVVGKKQVGNGREMHWIRNDRYFVGDPDDPGIVIQPMPCQQCENAPCETVCPVAATVHDSEGLNAMTYNRCIGTRYCSNNCPYKVRRFNFFNYTKDLPTTIQMQQNPDVTVRSRGVMEKCTFCIQRINRYKRVAKKEGRKVRDGEIQTACQQTCPTDAITFGNILDPESNVSNMKKLDRNYALLAELNVQPRNTFLARIRNPHPDLASKNDKTPEHE